jgi:nifR3 family TIM-barrel protein
MADLGFWADLERPIIGLAPMDGVTDAAFRHMIAKYSDPSVMFTEFTNVEGLARGATVMLKAFHYEEAERPIVAQIFGTEEESFYKTTVMLASLGFDGVDINMGCPVNKVAKQGSGAGLIRTPELAKEIVRQCQKGAKDWANGITLQEAGVHEDIIEACVAMRPTPIDQMNRTLVPVSVKTRIGYDKPVTEEWMNHLLEVEPAVISLHGRTLKQLYLGQSNWEEIEKAAAIVGPADTLFLGNGDIKTMDQAREVTAEMKGLDGVLIGRGVFGNPWFFGDHSPSTNELLKAVVEHSHYLNDNYPEQHFVSIRKHLAWYCHGFPGARALRVQLMTAKTADDVDQIITDAIAAHS